jgi:hypothetical protein
MRMEEKKFVKEKFIDFYFFLGTPRRILIVMVIHRQPIKKGQRVLHLTKRFNSQNFVRIQFVWMNCL